MCPPKSSEETIRSFRSKFEQQFEFWFIFNAALQKQVQTKNQLDSKCCLDLINETKDVSS
jgi:hypothetical protein